MVASPASIFPGFLIIPSTRLLDSTTQMALEAERFARFPDWYMFFRVDLFRYQCSSPNCACNQDGKWPFQEVQHMVLTLFFLAFCGSTDYGAQVGSSDPNAVSGFWLRIFIALTDFFYQEHYRHFLLVEFQHWLRYCMLQSNRTQI